VKKGGEENKLWTVQVGSRCLHVDRAFGSFLMGWGCFWRFYSALELLIYEEGAVAKCPLSRWGVRSGGEISVVVREKNHNPPRYVFK